MRFRLLAVGARQPGWVLDGCDEYARRLPGLSVEELPPGRRTRGGDPAQALEDEGRRLLARIPDAHHVVALDVGGHEYDTPGLARRLEHWLTLGTPVDFLIGGPDGLSGACRARAAELWSLSRLTLPHGLARVLSVEALYRAWSLRQGHPYHRA